MKAAGSRMMCMSEHVSKSSVTGRGSHLTSPASNTERLGESLPIFASRASSRLPSSRISPDAASLSE